MDTINVYKLEWWQKIVVVLVGLYILYFLLKALKIELPQIKSENFEDNKGNLLKCTMYYTTWCGYCKQAKPEWEKLSAEFNDKSINGTQILITKVDGDENPSVVKQVGVSGYPTFKFELDGEYHNYDGGRTYAEFKKYIESIVYSDSA